VTQQTYDAVVVGAGPNGLVAANRLADAGWSVVVLEAQPTVGGAARSDRELHPDFVQDTFSSFYPLGVASPALRSLKLEEHGLRWSHAPAVLGHARKDREWALMVRDREETAQLLDGDAAGDGAAWLDLVEKWDAIGSDVVGAVLSPFPPVKHGLLAAAKLRKAGGLGFVQELLSPALSLSDRFRGEAAQLLIAGNSGHTDVPLSANGSLVMGLILAMTGQDLGFPVPVGGAGELTGALARRFESLGGEIRTDCRVASVDIERGRAVGVRTADGARVTARRAVLADVVAPLLYGDLVAPEHLPSRVVAGMRRFRLDPGTIKVDWALSGPVPWEVTPRHAPGCVHVADSMAELDRTLTQVATGHVPDDPFLLMGQMTTSDFTRSPAGTESAWAYTHVPPHDSGGGDWGPDACERFADRMQQRVERLAPGFGSRVLARRVLGPRELEARNANLVGGSLNGGTSQLQQQLVFRPVPGLGRAETGIAGLYLASMSAHPGGGVHGACGMNAARAALAHARLTPWRR
jgi:phytoene dehydrogenase-like protein